MKKILSLFVAALVLSSATLALAHIDIPEITRTKNTVDADSSSVEK